MFLTAVATIVMQIRCNRPRGFTKRRVKRRRWNLKTALSLWKHIYRLPVILDLCLRKTRSGKSRDYRDVIDFEKLRFHNVFRPHENEKPAFSNSSGLKNVSEKLRFRDGLVWTVDLISVDSFSVFNLGADLGGGCRGAPPWDESFFSVYTYSLLRWFLSIALRIPTAHDFCVISACT